MAAGSGISQDLIFYNREYETRVEKRRLLAAKDR
jgi:hypothetical protein